MSTARQQQLVVLGLAATLILVLVAPRLGDAQEATPGPGAQAASDLVVRGEQIYSTTCIACHQAAGEGVTDVAIGGYPALAGNPFVTLENPAPAVQTILNGRAGMPTFRSFSDDDIAAVTTYIRQAWGNEAGPVDPGLVAEIRAQFAVTPPAPATPISTELPGSLVPAGTTGTPMPPADSDASPEVEGGATSGGITPIPTIGQ